jgi:hypothetical protein
MSLGTYTVWTELPPGVAGTQKTLDIMRAQVTACVLDPFQLTKKCCTAILESARAKGGDRVAEAHALFDWISGNVIFRRDSMGTDNALDPLTILAQAEQFQISGGKASRPVGDCNIQSALFAALGFTVGLPLVWVLIGPNPDEYTHIYTAMELVPGDTSDAGLLALDTATTHPTFGVHSTENSRWVVDAINAY